MRCLRSIRHQTAISGDVGMTIYLVDDGSTDGTSDAVSAEFSDLDVKIIRADGGLYWARGMAQAQEYCMSDGQFDFMLWLNDDVELAPDAVEKLLDIVGPANEPMIAVGATRDADAITYTGARRAGKRPTNLHPVSPNGVAREVDAFNGNIVLVTEAATRIVGTVDPRFEHAYGDNDYGLRAKAAGIPVLLAGEPLGCCQRNSVLGTWMDTSLSRRARTAQLFSRRAYPVRSHLLFNTRHAGLLQGTLFALGQYCVWLVQIWTPLNDESLSRKP